jgi:AraC-like DNA-binding protein/ligand-binding sensor protein
MNSASHLPEVSHGSSHRPEEVANRLRASGIFRGYQQAFRTATGLPLVLRAAGSFQAPLHGSKNGSGFCALMTAKSKSCAACLQFQQQVEASAIASSATLQCFAGLTESVVPIHLGETVIGYLQTGQVLLRPPTEKQFRAALRQLARWGVEVEVGTLRTAFFGTRVLTRAHYDAMIRLLESFGQHLSLLTNELMIKEAAFEPPAVGRARAFIAEHLAEPLSLEVVAQAAHMSAFYFCKVFKATTGLTFTDYVSRARIEKTKQLLLNPHVRVSEAAYESGFQSLSQFNRVFRRTVGEAPSTYRDRIHGGGRERPRNTLAFAA